MIDHVKEWEHAVATGQHAFEVELKAKPEFGGGICTAYPYARTREEARAKVAEHTDPSEEEIGEIRLQLPKFYGDIKLKPGCPCVVCQRD